MTRIILLDIDGVLVQPGGYRAALRATVQRFIGDFHIEENLLTDFEKRGISSEWDMAPLIIASYWNDILSRGQMENLSDDVGIAAKQIENQRKVDKPKHLSIPEFELVVGQYPAETAFRAGFFSNIPEALRKNLLMDSRSVHKSATMRVFQHFTLGNKKFEETYQLPAEFEAGSFLMTEDKSNINNDVIEKLNHPMNHPVAFTARPSGLPGGAMGSSVGYAPEAELALELVHMNNIPLMAFGKLEYIATQYGLDPATLLKPSPFQALAGVLTAWLRNDIVALEAVYDWHTTGKLNGQFKQLPKSFELIVVEDTMGGIRSVRAAGDVLRRAGFDVTTRTLGMTDGISSKAAAFDAADVPYFENWESLIKLAIF